MRTLSICFVLACLAISAVARGQFEGGEPQKLPENGVKLGKSLKQKWQVGVIVRATGGPCANLFGTIPVPTEWPEQTVKLVKEDVTPTVRKMSYRTLEGGVKQMLVEIPQLPAGQEAKALLTFEIVRHEILPPDDPARFVLPARPPKDVLKHLAQTPSIESRQPKIVALAKDLLADKKEASAWEQVEALYDGVRAKIVFRNRSQPKGAAGALKEGHGDFEDLTAVFVAVCRASKVPARTVWVEGSGYAEFYLQDDKGVGHWIPCQLVGERNFGGSGELTPILQKGDNFKVPEKKEPQRYVAEFLKAGAAAGKPDVNFSRSLIRAE